MTERKPVPAAVLFDLDGTLADSFEGIQHALNTALREEGLPERGLEWVRAHVGRGAAVLVRAAVGDDTAEDKARAVGGRFGDHYRATFLERTPALPGAAELLAFVWERTGGKVAVVSNKYEDLCRRWLRHVGLVRHVALVVGPDTYGVRKPDPGAMRPILAEFGVAARDALVVGDMEVDVEAARAIGAPMVGVQADPRAAEALLAAGARAVVPRLSALAAWLGDNGRGWRYDARVAGEDK